MFYVCSLEREVSSSKQSDKHKRDNHCNQFCFVIWNVCTENTKVCLQFQPKRWQKSRNSIAFSLQNKRKRFLLIIRNREDVSDVVSQEQHRNAVNVVLSSTATENGKYL